MSDPARLWVKICGLSSADHVRWAAEAGVDAVGFVFCERSPRNVMPDGARRLRGEIPAGVTTVAVFLHPGQGLLDSALDALEPDYVQLDVVDLDTLRLPAAQKVLPVLRSSADIQQLEAEAVQHDRFLLESGRSGAGERADWSVAARLAAQGGQLVLAGGLNPYNVGEAVRTVRPFGVDVSSGVESAPGDKDPQRMMEFVAAARAASARLRDEDSARGTR